MDCWVNEIFALQKNLFSAKYLETTNKSVLLVKLPDCLELHNKYHELISEKYKYNIIGITDQLEYFYNLHKLELSHINDYPITYTSIKCDIIEKLISENDIIRYYRYGKKDICEEVFKAHELNTDESIPIKLVEFNAYPKCKNCRNVIFHKTKEDYGNNDIIHNSISSTNHNVNILLSDERSSYKNKFNQLNKHISSVDNHICITTEKAQNLIYPCDICNYGSMLDWIPIMKKRGTYKIILLNCNPNSPYYGNISYQTINEDNDYDYIYSSSK